MCRPESGSRSCASSAVRRLFSVSCCQAARRFRRRRAASHRLIPTIAATATIPAMIQPQGVSSFDDEAGAGAGVVVAVGVAVADAAAGGAVVGGSVAVGGCDCTEGFDVAAGALVASLVGSLVGSAVGFCVRDGFALVRVGVTAGRSVVGAPVGGRVTVAVATGGRVAVRLGENDGLLPPDPPPHAVAPAATASTTRVTQPRRCNGPRFMSTSAVPGGLPNVDRLTDSNNHPPRVKPSDPAQQTFSALRPGDFMPAG